MVLNKVGLPSIIRTTSLLGDAVSVCSEPENSALFLLSYKKRAFHT